MRIPSPLMSFLRDQRGATFPIVLVFIMLGVGVAAMVIDMGYLYTMQNKVQTTAERPYGITERAVIDRIVERDAGEPLEIDAPIPEA